MDKVCNRILEIEDGHIKLYQGNYSDYKEQKDLEIKTNELEYENYIKERRKLERSIIETKSKAKGYEKNTKTDVVILRQDFTRWQAKMPGEVWIKSKGYGNQAGKTRSKTKCKGYRKIKVDILG